MCIFALVLAAGESRRFGSTKQLAKLNGVTLVARAVRLAENVCGDRSVLVVGSEWRSVLAACAPLRGFFVRNDDYRSGMASSIACGVGSVLDAADAALILMADQPRVGAGPVRSMMEAWRKAPDEILVSEYSGIQGPPAIFPAQCFESLMRLEGDRGARELVRSGRFRVRVIPFPDAGIDIDTPEDLAGLS